MKLSPFALYFAGVGTVVAALAVGFGSAVFLTSTTDVKETAVASAARSGEAKLTKIEKFEAAKREDQHEDKREASTVAPAGSASTLMAATITVPVVDKPAAMNAAPVTTPPPPKTTQTETPQPRQQASATPKDGVQDTAPFEGADNAVEIKPSKKPIADAAKSERKRRVAQRKTRDVIVQSRRDANEEAPAVAYREDADGDYRNGGGYRTVEEISRGTDGQRIVRTYETRSRGFGELFDTEDD